MLGIIRDHARHSSVRPEPRTSEEKICELVWQHYSLWRHPRPICHWVAHEAWWSPILTHDPDDVQFTCLHRKPRQRTRHLHTSAHVLSYGALLWLDRSSVSICVQGPMVRISVWTLKQIKKIQKTVFGGKLKSWNQAEENYGHPSIKMSSRQSQGHNHVTRWFTRSGLLPCNFDYYPLGKIIKVLLPLWGIPI